MSELSRRPGSRLTRREREKRAYQLVMAGMTAGAVTVVTAVLALVGVLSWSPAVIALLIAIACLLLFRRTVSR
jgi:lysylphosphatidylglycerol synthetase-like protein (DUF2156 family)